MPPKPPAPPKPPVAKPLEIGSIYDRWVKDTHGDVETKLTLDELVKKANTLAREKTPENEMLVDEVSDDEDDDDDDGDDDEAAAEDTGEDDEGKPEKEETKVDKKLKKRVLRLRALTREMVSRNRALRYIRAIQSLLNPAVVEGKVHYRCEAEECKHEEDDLSLSEAHIISSCGHIVCTRYLSHSDKDAETSNTWMQCQVQKTPSTTLQRSWREGNRQELRFWCQVGPDRGAFEADQRRQGHYFRPGRLLGR